MFQTDRFIEACRAALQEADAHAVTNLLDQITAALHVYGGDFFATPRSE